MTRNGKIARLPLAIREELNRRLQNGEKGRRLIAWLNEQPEVQAVLTAEFKGQPISAANLTSWKEGGYRTWEHDQSKLEGLALLAEQARVLHGVAPDNVAEQMSFFVTVNMALDMQRMEALPDGPDKARMQRELLGSLVLLRRGNFQGERLTVEREKLGFRREMHQKEIVEKFWEWGVKEENRVKILDRLLTPEQNAEEIARRKEEKRRKIKAILGIH